jgi:UPF0755 protein
VKKIFWLGLVALFGIILGFSLSMYSGSLSTPMSTIPSEVTYEIRQGSNLSKVAADLEQRGLIRNAKVLVLYAKLKRLSNSLKVGEYILGPHMTPVEILNILNSGKSVGRSFTVPEGLNVFEIAEMYEEEGFGERSEFLNLVFDATFVREVLGFSAPSLEGYLYPETYSLTKFTSTRELLKKMVSTFDEAYSQEVGSNAPDGWTKHQVVTLASIIEKETGAPEERPLISSVFHNRMKKRMRLQTDPTILYGIALDNKKVILKISREDLKRPHPYNTYLINGLPPGPIANPGAEALSAVIAPETSEFLYFVSQNDGTHVFSETYEQHSEAVRRFQMNSSARQGKSWRDLNKAKN